MGERRIPQQRRSRERYERILDVAAELIDRNGLAALTASAIIAAADTSTGAFYAYFDDHEAVVDALVARHLVGFVDVAKSTFRNTTATTVADAGNELIDGFAAYYRSEPGFVAIWHGGGLRRRHIEADQMNNNELLAVIVEGSAARRLIPVVNDEVISELIINLRIAEALLNEAFARDPNGDPSVIEQAKLTITLRLDYAMKRLSSMSTPKGD
jgi:AcrR family transcriptional regulator